MWELVGFLGFLALAARRGVGPRLGSGLLAGVAVCGVLALAPVASAATTYTWAGQASSNSWAQPGNWQNSTVPPSADTGDTIALPA